MRDSTVAPMVSGFGVLDPSIGSRLRTLTLKTENFCKKIGRFGKREHGFTKTLLSLFFQGFLSRGWF